MGEGRIAAERTRAACVGVGKFAPRRRDADALLRLPATT